jgi:hypothetical protein
LWQEYIRYQRGEGGLRSSINVVSLYIAACEQLQHDFEVGVLWAEYLQYLRSECDETVDQKRLWREALDTALSWPAANHDTLLRFLGKNIKQDIRFTGANTVSHRIRACWSWQARMELEKQNLLGLDATLLTQRVCDVYAFLVRDHPADRSLWESYVLYIKEKRGLDLALKVLEHAPLLLLLHVELLEEAQRIDDADALFQTTTDYRCEYQSFLVRHKRYKEARLVFLRYHATQPDPGFYRFSAELEYITHRVVSNAVHIYERGIERFPELALDLARFIILCDPRPETRTSVLENLITKFPANKELWTVYLDHARMCDTPARFAELHARYLKRPMVENFVRKRNKK